MRDDYDFAIKATILALACILGIILGRFGYTSDDAKMIEQCEANLPLTQHCEIVKTAVVKVDK